MSPILIVLIVIVAIAAACVGVYNGIVGSRNRCDNAWQNIDTQLQRRNDLIPNLVNTVKGYAAHEAGVLEAVTNARAAVANAGTPEAKMDASNQLSGALNHLFAVAEAYPDLKANTNFQQLQTELEDTENKISYARQSFNDCVLSYNNSIQTFPGNVVSGFGHFEPKTGFAADDAAKVAPVVDFGATPAAAPAAPAVDMTTAPAVDMTTPAAPAAPATPADGAVPPTPPTPPAAQ